MTKEIVLKRNEEKRIVAGHLWVFSNEIASIHGEPFTGDVVRLSDSSRRFLGVGFFNAHSLIAVRLLSRRDEAIDRDFFRHRIEKAAAFRRVLFPGAESFRAVFGESDGLPGLIVDKFGRYLVLQFLSAGMEKNAAIVVEALKEVFSPEGILGRNDSALRRLEGLEEKIEVLYGTIPGRVQIEENSHFFQADLSAGQKTGFFFDQRENRAALAPYCIGKRVLDGFCHSGAFGVYAAKAGAREVVWVDSSRPALTLAEGNARLNGVDTFLGINADVSEYLFELKKEKEKFDIIILDPPALIKSRKHFHAGYRVYRTLNASALAVLDSGGILATSSCSHNLSPEDFKVMLQESAAAAGTQVRVLEIRSQARDHPILLSMTQTEYLKFALLHVV